MSDKDEEDQASKNKLFMTEASGLEREEPRRPKSSKINSATTNDLATADDADEDDDNELEEDEDRDEDDMDDQEGDENLDNEDDENEDDENNYEEYMDEYENPFYQYQLPARGQSGNKNTIVDGKTQSVDGLDEREQAEEELRPLSAVAPKVFQQQDDGTAHIEISSTPAFQCLEEVCYSINQIGNLLQVFSQSYVQIAFPKW